MSLFVPVKHQDQRVSRVDGANRKCEMAKYYGSESFLPEPH